MITSAVLKLGAKIGFWYVLQQGCFKNILSNSSTYESVLLA